MAAIKKPIEIFTDGSHLTFGGYGIILLFGNKTKPIVSKTYHKSSIIRMEIKAIIHALEVVKPGYDIYVYCDNKIVIDTINKWIVPWIEYGVLDDKSNPELWRRFLKIKRKHIEGGSDISFCWFRSHTGHKYNEMVDKLAREASSGKKSVECKDDN